MRVLLKQTYFFFLLSSSILYSESNVHLLERVTYSIPLVKLSATFNESTMSCERVRITFNDSKDQAIITNLDDYYLKNSRNNSEKSTYREVSDYAYRVTDFESSQILKASKTLMLTLEIFEKDLQSSNWGKCLYLDAYLPRFLNGFYAIIAAATNSSDMFPKSIYIPDSLFDISAEPEKIPSNSKVELLGFVTYGRN